MNPSTSNDSVCLAGNIHCPESALSGSPPDGQFVANHNRTKVLISYSGKSNSDYILRFAVLLTSSNWKNDWRRMLSKYGTEQVGISAELAIADLTGVLVKPEYRERGRPELVEHMSGSISNALASIPKPIKHVAEHGNDIDFELEGSRTLSVKTNMKNSTKICPQRIGQPPREAFWRHFRELVPAGVAVDRLSVQELNALFKLVARANISFLLTEYWKNLFDCDFLIIVRDVLTEDDQLSNLPQTSVYQKSVSPSWDASRITYTKDLANWNESCTVKYDGVSIGEFQVHNNRNCYKFRFITKGLVAAGLL